MAFRLPSAVLLLATTSLAQSPAFKSNLAKFGATAAGTLYAYGTHCGAQPPLLASYKASTHKVFQAPDVNYDTYFATGFQDGESTWADNFKRLGPEKTHTAVCDNGGVIPSMQRWVKEHP